MEYPELSSRLGEVASLVTRKSMAVEAARVSFFQRVREFLEQNPQAPEVRPMRVALEEYDRMQKKPLDDFRR